MRQQLTGSNVDPGSLVHLEMALPGVHERFNGLSRKMDAQAIKLDCQHETVQAVQESVQVLDERLGSFETRLSTWVRNACTGILQEMAPVPHPPRPVPEEVPPRPPQAPPQVAPTLPLTGFFMSPKYASLNSIYEEWYGVGACLGRPVEGGIARLEASFKSKWRSHFNKAQNQQFSRIKMIIGGLVARVEEMGGRFNDEDAMLEFENYFQANRKSPSKLLLYMKSIHLVKSQKTRGRHVTMGGPS